MAALSTYMLSQPKFDGEILLLESEIRSDGEKLLPDGGAEIGNNLVERK